MSNEDRQALLAFAWGRRRLPNSGDFTFTVSKPGGLDSVALATDIAMPFGHTCFFRVW